MDIKNNQIAFTGVIYPRNLFPVDAPKIEKFVKENKPAIDMFEKNFKTDIRINEDLETLSFLHRGYGNLSRYGISDIKLADFGKSIQNITERIGESIQKAHDYIKKIK